MSKPLTFADVSMLALAAGILKERKVWSVFLTGSDQPEVSVGHEALAGAIQDTGAAPTFIYQQAYGSWKVFINYGGMKLSALASDDDLRLFGFTAVRTEYPPTVAPLVTEGVRADA